MTLSSKTIQLESVVIGFLVGLTAAVPIYVLLSAKCTTETTESVPTFPQLDTIAELGISQNTYYFPILTSKNVTFTEAPYLCSSLANYALASSISTNPKIMTETGAFILNNAISEAVWVGGWFNLSSNYPHFIYWTDGSVRDFRKAPQGLFCSGVANYIEEALAIKAKNGTKLPSILPLVRYTNASSCLNVLMDEFRAPGNKNQLQALCFTKRPTLRRMQDNGTIELTRHLELSYGMYNVGKNMYKLIDGEDFWQVNGLVGGTFSLVPVDSRWSTTRHYTLGIRDRVPYGYAREYCRPMKPSNGTIEGDLFSDHVFNGTSVDVAKYRERLSQNFLNIRGSWKDFVSRSMFGSTAGYYDFRSENYRMLHWHYVNGESRTVDDRFNITFPFCHKLGLIVDVKDAYAEFSRWYSAAGNMTTGPNRVYLAIELRPGSESCLRPVFDELYWPGAYSWLPLCSQAPF